MFLHQDHQKGNKPHVENRWIAAPKSSFKRLVLAGYMAGVLSLKGTQCLIDLSRSWEA